MTIRISDEVRDRMAVAGLSGYNRLYIYAGTQPTDPNIGMDEGTELAVINMTMNTPVGGITSLTTPAEAVALNTGTAGWARLGLYYYSHGYRAVDGSVGVPGTPNADFFLSTTDIVAGNTVRLMDLTIYFPG